MHLARKCDAVVDTFEDAKFWLAREKRRWLLILDNADDPEFDYSQYFPLSTKGSILITSRVPECCVHQTAGHERLGGLELLDAKNLLLESAGFELNTSSENRSNAEKIVQVLGSHTLAIAQAGAAIRNHFCSLNDYTLWFKQRRDWLLKHHSSQARSQYGDVYATFEVSAKILEASDSQTNADAVEILGVLANLHSENIPFTLFERSFAEMKNVKSRPESAVEHDLDNLSEWHIARLPRIFHQAPSENDFVLFIRKALHVLASSSLITVTDDSQGSSISMHSLTHAWAKDRLTLPAQRIAWEATGSILALSFAEDDDYSTLWRFQPHALAFVGYKKDYDSVDPKRVEIDRILVRIGRLFMSNRDHSTAINLFRQIVENVAVHYVLTQRSLRIIKMNIAWCEIFFGKPSAVNELESIHEADKQTLEITDPDRLKSQRVLAQAYLRNGQHKEAAELFEKILEIDKSILEIKDPDRLSSQHGLARAYTAIGQPEKAAELLENIEIRKTTLHFTHPNRLSSQHELACAYIAIGRPEKAAELLEHIVEIRKTTLHITHPDRLVSQHQLARAYRAINQPKKAVELLEQVVEIQKTTLRSTHPHLLRSQYTLAVAYSCLRQYSKAFELATNVIEAEATLENRPLTKRTIILLQKIQNAMAAKESQETVSQTPSPTLPSNPVLAKPPGKLQRFARSIFS